MKSRYALLAASAALLALLLVMTAVGLSRVETINRQLSDTIRCQRIEAGLISEALKAVRGRSQAMSVLYAVENPALRDQAYERYQALTRLAMGNIGKLRSLDISAAEQPELKQAYAAVDRAGAVGDEIAASLMTAGAAAATIQLTVKSGEAQDEIEDALYLLQEAGRVAAQNKIGEAGGAARKVILLIVGVWVLVLLAAGFLAALIMRQVGRTENELQFEKELAQVTLHSIGDGVITTDAAGRVEYLNPVAERYTGWLTPEAHGKPLEEIYRVIDERTGRAVEPFSVDATGSREERDSGSVRLVDRSGRECPIRYSLEAIRSRNDRVLGMIVVFHDISQIRAMSQQLIWQASHDALTGLVNRREFE
ncbi:MAG: PAS domain-containing protein, partial [Burkholderiales bacterium]|nr:PAS domain-containing protein [Burkholderiales bacterium]